MVVVMTVVVITAAVVVTAMFVAVGMVGNTVPVVVKLWWWRW